MRHLSKFIVIFVFLGWLATPGFALGPQDAVVKIFVTSNPIDYFRPWQTQGSQPASGSGFIIDGNRILTNAHVVNDHTFIQVRREADPRRYPARVLMMGHDCDLAILTVDDPEFFKAVAPLPFGELPKLQDLVTVVGFPMGGDKISVTEGVVSRIEIIPFAESGKKLLAVQIDAAINPGNSGGPVLQNNKVVGVAMQIIWGSQNIGYMIPMPVIEHFLADAKDGTYDGFPMAGIEYYSTENPAIKAYYRESKAMAGVLLSWVWPFSSADGVLLPEDIVLAINNIPIAEDGTFQFRDNERLGLSHLITSRQIGDEVTVKVLRDGQEQIKKFTLKPFLNMVAYPNEIQRPPYYIYGGFVFSVLSMDLLRAKGPEWWKEAPPNFLEYIYGSERLNSKRKKEIVTLLEVLPDDVNVGYHNYREEVIQKVNDQEFSSFEEFVLLIENAKTPFLTIETDQKVKIFLDTNNIAEKNQAILKRNFIPRQYSESIEKMLSQKRIKS